MVYPHVSHGILTGSALYTTPSVHGTAPLVLSTVYHTNSAWYTHYQSIVYHTVSARYTVLLVHGIPHSECTVLHQLVVYCPDN